MGSIIWLASYPKSGNTWFRVFLSNLLGEPDTPADINELHRTPIASARNIFDEEVGIEASDLTPAEIDRLRPEVYEKLADAVDDILFMKVHDAYTLIDGLTPLLSKSASKCAIYFIRNPLDVAVSFAHHSGDDYDRTIHNMADEKMTFCGKTKKLHNQLRQQLLTWSNHVKSWTKQTDIPVCVLRYEDMKQNQLKTFSRAIRFAKLDYTQEQIGKALSMSAFDELQRQEQEKGFKEKSPACDRFFRQGIVGSWKEELTESQVERIIMDHRAVMKQFGYV